MKHSSSTDDTSLCAGMYIGESRRRGVFHIHINEEITAVRIETKTEDHSMLLNPVYNYAFT